MTPDEIRRQMAGWKSIQDDRDKLVRKARQAGIEITEISQLMGLSRTTVYKILGLEAGTEK